jgi:hypothetical protein
MVSYTKENEIIFIFDIDQNSSCVCASKALYLNPNLKTRFREMVRQVSLLLLTMPWLQLQILCADCSA